MRSTWSTRDLARPGLVGGAQLAADRPPRRPCASKDGETLTTDGPFAETKEALGGFYLIDAAEPRRRARARGHDPGGPDGGAIEVRPMVEH